jgi:hypothetical protein
VIGRWPWLRRRCPLYRSVTVTIWANNPLRFTALVSEAALRQEIGGPAVLRRQLEHIADMVERHPETIEFRVIPFSTPACGLFGAATVNVIDFENAWLPTVIWQETVTSWGVVNDTTSRSQEFSKRR